MESRPLGRFQVSVVGLGCNNFGMRCDEDTTAKVVNAAPDAGITPSIPRTSTGTRRS
jgi:aryl-alcohol dehydrogenase-like predicted oxidoreductase